MAARLLGFLQCWHSFAPGLVRLVAAAESAGLHVHCRGLGLSALGCSAVGRLMHLTPLLLPGACPEAGLLLPPTGLVQLLMPGAMLAQARLPLAGRLPHQAE